MGLGEAKGAMWVSSEILRCRCWLGPEETELSLGVVSPWDALRPWPGSGGCGTGQTNQIQAVA